MKRFLILALATALVSCQKAGPSPGPGPTTTTTPPPATTVEPPPATTTTGTTTTTATEPPTTTTTGTTTTTTTEPPTTTTTTPPPKPAPCTGTPVPTGKVNAVGLATCTFCDGHVDVCPGTKPSPKPTDPCAGVSTTAYGADVRMRFPVDRNGRLGYQGIGSIFAFQERDGSWKTVADPTALEYGPNGYLPKDEFTRGVQPTPGQVATSCSDPNKAGGFDDGGIRDHAYKGTVLMKTQRVYPVCRPGSAGCTSPFDDKFITQNGLGPVVDRFVQRVRQLSDSTGHPRADHPFMGDNGCTGYPCATTAQ